MRGFREVVKCDGELAPERKMRRGKGTGDGGTTGEGERSIGHSMFIRAGNEDNAVAGNNNGRGGRVHPAG